MAAMHLGGEDGVCINLFTGRRLTLRRGTLQAQFSAAAGQFDYFNLPACDLPMATLTNSDFIERMPEMKFVELAKCIELVFDRQRRPRSHRHNERMEIPAGPDNQEQ